ncbi:GNAT family N-acetyltransferase [Oceanobacillus massiliensis]|uniref:GNAT family N-acetyltransferase n=1 Tax=Oceanobacillus massiliensis TaxID=1465765 RepID=UPI003017F302
MNFQYKYVERYENFSRKEEVTDILEQVEQEFTPPLSSWPWMKGNSSRERMAFYFRPHASILMAIDTKTDTIAGLFHLREDDDSGELKAFLPNLKIETVIVAPAYRNIGLAGKMYQEVEELNKSHYKKPYLASATWESNEKQHHLYRKNGYRLAFISTYPMNDQLKRYYYVKQVE